MSETRTWTGGCHCGAVRYEVESDLSQTITCNCSMCSKTGTILTFVPGNDFRLLSGEDSLSDYQFNKKVIHHLFCRSCGVRSFGRGADAKGEPMVAVNVRCLDEAPIAELKPYAYDGRSA